MKTAFNPEVATMRCRYLNVWASVVIGALTASLEPARAQVRGASPTEQTEAVRVALKAVYRDLLESGELQPGGGVVITPHHVIAVPSSRHLPEGPAVGEATLRQLADSMGARVGRLDTIRVCASRYPSSCRLKDASVVFSFTELSHTDSLAVLVVRAVHQVSQDTRQPVHTLVVKVELVRHGARWAISSKTVIGVT